MTINKFFNILMILLIFSCIGLGTWGWLSVEPHYDGEQVTIWDALYRSITAFVLSDSYEYSFRWKHDWRINAARWCGLGAFLIGAIKALALLLSNRVAAWRAMRRKHHYIVIGDDTFAESIVNSLLEAGKKVNWLCAPESINSSDSKLYVHHDAWHYDNIETFGLSQARSVVIAMGEDAQSITTARAIRTAVPDQNQLSIFATILNPWIALSIDDLSGLNGIKMFSRPQAAARAVHRKHPPFLIANEAGQKSIHAVIFGFDRHGEAILLDLLLYCLTSNLGVPKITIVDKAAGKLQNQMKLRYPELHLSAELRFIEGALQGNETSMDEKQLLSLAGPTKITCAYVCLGKDDDTLNTALALRAIVLRNQLIEGPIFLRLSHGDSINQTESGVSHLQPGQLVAYGSFDAMVAETGILNDDKDTLAKLFHQAYQQIADNTVSDVDWNELPEDKKESNRRSVPHLLAKLASSGFDIEPFIKQLESTPQLEQLPYVPDFIKNAIEHEQLAILEHERWMADRRVNGWQYSADRDDQRKFHPDLKPFAELSETSKSYDLEFIRMLAELLKKSR